MALAWIEAADDGEAGFGSRLSSNRSEPGLEERLESGVNESLSHGGYLESNSGIRQ